MSTAIAKTDTRVIELFSEAKGAIMANKLDGVDEATLKEVVLHHFRLNPDHLNCTPESIVKCMVTTARMGLSLAAKEIHYVPYGRELTPSPDYKGLLKLGYQSGLIESLVVEEVCENDAFRVVIGDGGCFVHEPKFRDRGNPYLYYVFARMKDGSSSYEMMTVEEVEALATNTPAWRNYRKQMRKKCTIHRFFRQRLHLLDSAANEALGALDVLEYGGGSPQTAVVIDGDTAPASKPVPRFGKPPKAIAPTAEPVRNPDKLEPEASTDKRDPIAWAASDAAAERIKGADVLTEFRFAWQAVVKLADHNRTAAGLILSAMSACFKDGEHHRTQLDVVRSKPFAGAYRTARKVADFNYTDLAAWIAAVTLQSVGETLDHDSTDQAVRSAADLIVDVDDEAGIEAAREVAE